MRAPDVPRMHVQRETRRLEVVLQERGEKGGGGR